MRIAFDFFLHAALVFVSVSVPGPVPISVWTLLLLGVVNEHALGVLHSRISYRLGAFCAAFACCAAIWKMSF